MPKRRVKSVTQRRRENLLRQVTRMEKRGYDFPDNIRDKIKAMSPQKLTHYKSEDLYKEAKSYDYDTGEIISGTQRRNQERSEAARKGARTRKQREEATQFDRNEVALYNLDRIVERLRLPPKNESVGSRGQSVYRRDSVQDFEKETKDYLLEIIERQIEEEGRQAFAERIQSRMSEIIEPLEILEYGYYEGTMLQARQALVNIFTDRLLNTDEMERLGTESEYYEDWNSFGVQNYEQLEESD